MVGLRGVREGRVCDGEEEDGHEEEHAAAEHLVGGEICAEGGGRGRAGGVSVSNEHELPRTEEVVGRERFSAQALVKCCAVCENVKL